MCYKRMLIECHLLTSRLRGDNQIASLDGNINDVSKHAIFSHLK